jgi:hypothetical protein
MSVWYQRSINRRKCRYTISIQELKRNRDGGGAGISDGDSCVTAIASERKDRLSRQPCFWAAFVIEGEGR